MDDEHLNAFGANNRLSYGILKSGSDTNSGAVATDNLEIRMENIHNNNGGTSTTGPSTGIYFC